MRTLVIVSYYDARPVTELLALLQQLETDPNRSQFDLLIVVNRDDSEPSSAILDLADTDVLVRPNYGFNIGAWQAGWQARPGYDHYIFLQDDCFIRSHRWLEAIRRALARPRTGFVGEGYIGHRNWAVIDRQWQKVHAEFDRLAIALGMPRGYPPAHLQTVMIAAAATTLHKTGGFVVGTQKADAVAGEIMSSVRARHLGLKNRQISHLPYNVIGHPQWESYRAQHLKPHLVLTAFVKHVLRG